MAPGVDYHGPEISLIVGTVGRVEALSSFLDSLLDQPVDRVEMILVDQSRDDRIGRLLAERDDPVALQHLRVPWRGISRARNLGARMARTSILGFPDDDCQYPPGAVERVLAWLEAHPDADGLSCRVSDRLGRASAGGYMSPRSHWVTRGNVWRSAVSPGIFVRRSAHDAIAGFDERLGAGAATHFGSAEDSDYLLRALQAGGRIYYAADQVVHHPRTIGRKPHFGRGWSYGRGMGFVLRKHGLGPGWALYFASLSAAAAVRSGLKLEFGPATARLAMGVGRLAGWLQSGPALTATKPEGGTVLPGAVAVQSEALRRARL